MNKIQYIEVQVDHENKTIIIKDNYTIDHTKIYLEICQKFTEILSPEVFTTYKIKLNDKTFKNIKDFANKNKLDLKAILDESDKKRKDNSEDIDLDLEKRFTYHSPKEDDAEKFELIRDFAKEYAYMIKTLCPDSRERALALTKLEEVVMWANASVAREGAFPVDRGNK